MKRFLFLLFLLPLASCFHKDVMEDRADDVGVAIFYSGAEGKMIITREDVFQVQSKETNGSVTNFTGYNECRISSYDLATGKLLSRVNMGHGIEKAFVILGCTPGKLWVYSIDPALGLHCRNPKTLDVIQNEAALSASGPLKNFDFARPDWTKLKENYGWKARNGLVMITDMQGYHYYYDPDKNTLEKTENDIHDYSLAVNYLSVSGKFSDERYFSLSSGSRRKLMLHEEDSTARFSYLSGQFVIDNDPRHEAARKKTASDSLQRIATALNDSLAILFAHFPTLKNDVLMFQAKTPEEHEALDQVRALQRRVDQATREVKRISRERTRYPEDALLSDGPGNFFILHASNISDTAKMLLTKVHYGKDGFAEMWHLRLNDFFFTPAKAYQEGAFGEEFDKGNPQFGFQWFDCEDGKIVLISQLEMTCIDAATGR
ncbi:MAG TPA: hypothetical protein VFU15_06330, partial [Bacteroidia bacterium]|nr:hypothetical protein [Bacteroidia bacterium]